MGNLIKWVTGVRERRRKRIMLDLIMVGILAVSFGLVVLLAYWCQKQIDSKE